MGNGLDSVVLTGPTSPVVRCPAQHVPHRRGQQGQLPFLAPKPQSQQGPAQSPLALGPTDEAERTVPSSGVLDFSPKAESATWWARSAFKRLPMCVDGM